MCIEHRMLMLIRVNFNNLYNFGKHKIHVRLNCIINAG